MSSDGPAIQADRGVWVRPLTAVAIGVVAGNPEYKRWDGTCEIWLSAEPEQELITILAWRVPEKVAGSLSVPLAQLAEVAARTVVITPPPDPAAAATPEAGQPGAAE